MAIPGVLARDTGQIHGLPPPATGRKFASANDVAGIILIAIDATALGGDKGGAGGFDAGRMRGIFNSVEWH
jgi:hypothetical protein